MRRRITLGALPALLLLAGTATPLMPWYRSLLEWAHDCAGLDPSEFRGFRFEMAFPPVPGQVILYSNLLPAAERQSDSNTR